MRNHVLVVLMLLGPTSALLSVTACGASTPSKSTTVSSVNVEANAGSAGAGAVTPAATPVAVGQPALPAMYTLTVTLSQGHHLSGPYAANLSGPNGFTCYMSQSQDNVSCLAVSYPAGTTVPIVVTISAPALANDWPVYETVGCDVTSMNTCTVLMNANKTVTIRAGRRALP